MKERKTASPCWTIPVLVLALVGRLAPRARGLSMDGVLLQSFKYSISSDPLDALATWNYGDDTPCSWAGVTCGGAAGDDTTASRVVGLSLRGSRLAGSIPSDMGMLRYLRTLDLSNNSLNGTLPDTLFGAAELRVLDLSDNRVEGPIPPAVGMLGNLQQLNLSNNALTGSLPANLTALPNLTVVSLKNNYLTGIVVGDIAGIAIVAAIFVCVRRIKKRKKSLAAAPAKREPSATAGDAWSSTSSESRGFTRWSCLRKRGDNDGESSETNASDTDDKDDAKSFDNAHRPEKQEPYKQGMLVTIDKGGGGGDKMAALELETLLKASAYILGATGSSIMYKAVLEDGTTLAVRRIGESGVERFKDFEAQVRAVAKLVHPNLVRVRGFYWGADEKLIIYDFVPNGSLANARYRKVGSSPCHLPWEARLRIAKGVARGLAYLHEKKHVHGNLKPSNILLGGDMEPKIGDFGLERLVTGDTSYKAGGSARNFGSKRSTASRDSLQDLGPGPSPSPSPSSIGGISPYHAPESLRSLKPSPKWDVFSFGVILLELLSGKVVAVDELGQANGVVVDDQARAMRMADVTIRGDLEGKEEALLACFRLGLSCASPLAQKRPSMKEALHVLEKIPFSSTSMHYYGHLL
ncbi:hypothetical protein EUGRSUZ_I00762 [Eucalyptus grandis]|uniref:Uncharacterized protein n=1 Tax=Eucalyptus grandis TaxID=71139 RepID=A0ACC3JDC1_EUCGR|nr:hypothetical protein EUGRSUZ_I00762 [Eucalyptus grandis]